MSDKVSGGVMRDMLKGLKNRSPSCSDSSTKLPTGPNVSSGATRSETAPADKPDNGGRTT